MGGSEAARVAIDKLIARGSRAEYVAARTNGKTLTTTWSGYPLSKTNQLVELEEGLRVALPHLHS